MDLLDVATARAAAAGAGTGGAERVLFADGADATTSRADAGNAPPKMKTRVDVDAVLKQLIENESARVLVYGPEDLVPKRLTPRQTRKMLQGLRTSVLPAVVTSRVMGAPSWSRAPMEHLGDANNPSRPTSPIDKDSDPSRF